ncbi:MAG: hypothetical protein U0414_26725 [Polyangiaceae bacterium]
MKFRASALATCFAGLMGTACDDGGASTGGSGGGGGGGAPPAMQAEAGFIEVPPATVAGPNFSSRMFYWFQPAKVDPANAPVVLLFNGGPGAATTSILGPYGTAAKRLDPDGADDAPPIDNPDAYTEFANLLYVDERMTGFSYGLSPSGAPACLGTDAFYVQDAGDFAFALLTFLDSHPALADNPVVVMGESYGGTRAPMLLHMLRNYATPLDPPIPGFPDVPTFLPWLRDKVQAHFDALTPNDVHARTPDEVTAQFGWMVLIQPNFFGMQQFMFQDPLLKADPDFAAYFQAPADTLDPYDVRKPIAFLDHLDAQVKSTVRDPTRLADLLGVSLEDIHGLAAADRGDAFRFFDLDDPAALATAEAPLRAVLGELGPKDAYWEPLQGVCHPTLGDVNTANALLRLLPHLHTFVTNARYDSVVYTEAIGPLFDQGTTYTVTLEPTPASASRPGELHFVDDAKDFRVRFPTYEAGHEVTVSAWKEFGADLREWLVAEKAIP